MALKPVRVPTLIQSQPIVDDQGNPNTQFVQAWNNSLQQIVGSLNSVITAQNAAAAAQAAANTAQTAATAAQTSATTAQASVTAVNYRVSNGRLLFADI